MGRHVRGDEGMAGELVTGAASGRTDQAVRELLAVAHDLADVVRGLNERLEVVEARLAGHDQPTSSPRQPCDR